MLNALFVLSGFVVFIFMALPAEAATLHFSPSTGNFTTANNFTMSVMVSTNEAMNGAEGMVQFPTDKLEAISVSKSGSIFSLWIQEPSYSNLGPVGKIHFQGVKLNPGFVGNNGKIADVVFHVKSIGVADVTFGSGAVLANDGKGTNIISSFGSAVYTLKQGVAGVHPSDGSIASGLPDMPSVRHFVQSKTGDDVMFNFSDQGPRWSNSRYAKLTWEIPGNVTGLATALDDKPFTEPATTASNMVDHALFPSLNEGKQYFHIRFVNQHGKGPVLHYPMYIDVTSPKYFSVEFLQNEVNYKSIYSTSNPKPLVSFFTDDALSGVDRYELKVGDGAWINANDLVSNGMYSLPKQKVNLIQTVIARAYDQAGNFTDATAQIVVEPIALPVILRYQKHVSSPKEKIVIEGKASPQAEVEVILEKDKALVATVKADDEGAWRFVYADKLRSGMYAVTARQVLNNGAESLYTDPVYVAVNSLLGMIQSIEPVSAMIIGALIIILLVSGRLQRLVIFLYYWKRFGLPLAMPGGLSPDGASPRVARGAYAALPAPKKILKRNKKRRKALKKSQADAEMWPTGSPRRQKKI